MERSAAAQASAAPAAPLKKAEKTVAAGEQATREVPHKKEIPRVRTLEETAGAAVVNIFVQPWGDVYLDGKLQGVSPPLIELQVAAGKHEIEIRNSTFSAYKRSIKIKSGEKIKIQHKFVN
jgi:hypothetical protein